jgi:hypothetical protein
MVSGPYRGGAKTAAQRKRNLTAMNTAALALFRRGHVPIIGVNLALPVIEAAGGAEFYDEIMMPISLAAAARCDAVLRIGGPSKGADDEVASFGRKGLPIYRSLAEVPAAR